MPVYQIVILIFLNHIKNIMNFSKWPKDTETSVVKRPPRGRNGSKHRQVSRGSHAHRAGADLYLSLSPF